MSAITLSCQGDNVWSESFATERYAIWFLVSLLSRDERYRNGDDVSYATDLAFDVEDDLITWEQDGHKQYCAGWHWRDEQYDKPIMLGQKTLYNLFMELADM